MTDKRQHRGANPEDARAFAAERHPVLNEAAFDLSWLLSRGYAEKSATKLTGDRYALTERQRIAVRRCACSEQCLASRAARMAAPAELQGATVRIDGYNVLTTIEAALGGGAVLIGRDGCYRDMASMHGNFKRVAETPIAIRLIGSTLAKLGVTGAEWFLDQPVSNSGRLKLLILECARDAGWNWTVELVPDPDRILPTPGPTVATADSGILDACERWFNLAAEVVREHANEAWIVDLRNTENVPS